MAKFHISYTMFYLLAFLQQGTFFQKVLREPVRHLRSEGIKIITFIDDVKLQEAVSK